MSRLTIENDGQYLPMALCTVGHDGKVDDCDGCADYCEEQDVRDNRCPGCAVQACFDRLGVYEDAGYAPEQIRNFDEMYLEKCREVNDLRKRIPKNNMLAQPTISKTSCKFCGEGNKGNLESIGFARKHAGQLIFDLDIYLTRRNEDMELLAVTTVGEAEIHYLRINVPYCPMCGREMRPHHEIR